MRHSFIYVFAAAVVSGVGCTPAANNTQAGEVTSTPEGTHGVPDTVASAPLAAAELLSLRRPPVFTPAGPPADVSTQPQRAGRSRLARYLAGDRGALTAEQERGLALFVRTGCTSCHDGTSVGGDEYTRLGLALPFRNLTDSGRFAQTHDPADLFAFKVPSLLNVETRPPYFHDGSVARLTQAVRLMARHQLGADLTEDQVRDIREFLSSLSAKPSTVAPIDR